MTDTNGGFGSWAAPTDDQADLGAPPTGAPASTPGAGGGSFVPGATPMTPGGPSQPRFTAADDAFSQFKPGIITLRPLGFGQMLDGGIKAIRHNPRVMLGVNAIITLASVAVLFGFGAEYFARTLNFDAEGSADMPVRAIVMYFVGALVSAFVALLVTVVTSISVGRSVIGEVVSVKEAWTQSLRRTPTVLVITLLMSLGMMALVALVVGAVFAAAAVSPALAALVGVVLALGVGVGTIWLAIKLSLALPVAVLEKSGTIHSFRRSWELTKGNFWMIFAVLLVSSIITSLIQQVITAPVAVFMPLAIAVGASTPTWLMTALLALATAAGAYISYVYLASVTAIVYVNQRMRREGFDLTLARAVAERQAAAAAGR